MFGDYDFLSDRCEKQEKNFEKFIYDIKFLIYNLLYNFNINKKR